MGLHNPTLFSDGISRVAARIGRVVLTDGPARAYPDAAIPCGTNVRLCQECDGRGAVRLGVSVDREWECPICAGSGRLLAYGRARGSTTDFVAIDVGAASLSVLPRSIEVSPGGWVDHYAVVDDDDLAVLWGGVVTPPRSCPEGEEVEIGEVRLSVGPIGAERP